MTVPSIDTMPSPDLLEPLMVMRWKSYPVKSPHVSEPNIRALQHTADRNASYTFTLPLLYVWPSAQSLLNASASSLAELMTFQPSRLLAVSTRKPLDVMLLQALVSMAKCPPRRRVMPSTRRPSHRVSEMILSASPWLGLPVMRFPPPSMVPEPTKAMFVS